MSVELVLIPLAIAAIGAWQTSRTDQAADGRTVCRVGTRMRDERLLQAALVDTGAMVRTEPGRLIADWQGVQATLVLGVDGIWGAHLVGDVDESRAVSIITAVDQAYGRQVQAAVVERLKQRAPDAGMRVESQTVGDDDTVTLVLAVQAGA
jgi:hypothetical protein